MQSPTLSTTPAHMVRESSIPALTLDGRRAATVIKNQIKERIDVLVKEQDQSNGGIGCARRVPGLGIVMANG